MNGGGDGEATTVEFPESDEQLIIVDEPGAAGLIVSGDSATGDVTRMAVSRADGTVTAEFDDQGRPTSVDINVDGVVLFDITYNDDGTFDYTLTESGSVISDGTNLIPDEAATIELGFTAKVTVRSQFATELDFLLCAANTLDNVAQIACTSLAEFEDSTELTTLLAQELRADRKALNAAVLTCAGDGALSNLKVAEEECGDCAEVREGDRATDCCRRISKAKSAANNLIASGFAVLAKIVEDTLFSAEIPEELCGEPPTVSVMYTLRNTDARGIHIFPQDEPLNVSNRVMPGATVQRTLENLEDGARVTFHAGRNTQPFISATTCLPILGDNNSFDVIWNGSTLSCDRT